jgi:hypothetical protein
VSNLPRGVSVFWMTVRWLCKSTWDNKFLLGKKKRQQCSLLGFSNLLHAPPFLAEAIEFHVIVVQKYHPRMWCTITFKNTDGARMWHMDSFFTTNGARMWCIGSFLNICGAKMWCIGSFFHYRWSQNVMYWLIFNY